MYVYVFESAGCGLALSTGGPLHYGLCPLGHGISSKLASNLHWRNPYEKLMDFAGRGNRESIFVLFATKLWYVNNGTIHSPGRVICQLVCQQCPYWFLHFILLSTKAKKIHVRSRNSLRVISGNSVKVSELKQKNCIPAIQKEWNRILYQFHVVLSFARLNYIISVMNES